VKASKDSVPYNPSISTLNGKCLLPKEIADFSTAARKSQTKV